VSAEPVGVVEVAARLGVTRKAVDQWRRRALGFPEPRWTVGGRPAWSWPDVEEWARRTGRIR
jgi:predicted DNA-binding transcriptional regulator AlpA